MTSDDSFNCEGHVCLCLYPISGTDKSKALQGQVWLSDIGDFAEFNAVWDAWVTPGAPPVRACTEAKLAAPFFTVEVMITAAA